jgi:hypothetical protein
VAAGVRGPGAAGRLCRVPSTLTARRSRGLVLLAGGLALALLVGDGRPLSFVWLPLVTGLVYLAAAAAGGRDGALWGPALVVLGFGAAVVLTVEGPLGGELFSSVVLTGVGAGALVATLLPRYGVPVPAPSVAAAVLLSGVFFLLSERGGEVFRSTLLYGALLVAWGVWELLPRSGRAADSEAASRSPSTP